MVRIGNLLMMASLLTMIASIVAVIVSGPMWLAAACPGAFIMGLAGKILAEGQGGFWWTPGPL